MLYLLSALLIAAALTAMERFAPFLLFSKGQPPSAIRYLGRVLPLAMMAMLVVFCYKGIDFSSPAGFAPQLTAGLVTGLLHLWRGSTMLSIAGGTAVYMVLIRTIFLQ